MLVVSYFMSSVYVPNIKSVANFLLVDFGWGCLLLLLLVVTGGKQGQLLLRPTEVQFGLQVRSGVCQQSSNLLFHYNWLQQYPIGRRITFYLP